MGQSAFIDKYKYLGIVMNTEGNLTEHMHEMGQKIEKIMIQTDKIGEESQEGTEKIKGELKLFETCLA